METNPFAEVAVVDIKMPFGSMVMFMVKWAIASIPALLILGLLSALIWAVIGGTFSLFRLPATQPTTVARP